MAVKSVLVDERSEIFIWSCDRCQIQDIQVTPMGRKMEQNRPTGWGVIRITQGNDNKIAVLCPDCTDRSVFRLMQDNVRFSTDD